LPKTLKDFVDEVRGHVREVPPADVKARIDRGEEQVILDVREESETAEGVIPGAVRVPRGVLERDVLEKIPDQRRRIICYCRGGQRSMLACDTLQKMGYGDVMSMAGGWREWTALDYPVEK
jgi:sulfur-carrier protein adenylyltransferase/sulfurtransferase